jgi:cytochrome b561
MSSEVRYTATAIALHWLVAIAIVANLALGLTMVEIQGITPTKIRMVNWHKWLGVSILLLVTIRALWRLGHRPPPLPAALPGWQRAVAGLTHGGLYVLMFAIPLTGYFFSLAAGYPVVFLGLVKLPVLMAPDPELKEILGEAHELLSWALIALLLLHVGAALKHHLIDRDDVLRRMLPGRAR